MRGGPQTLSDQIESNEQSVSRRDVSPGRQRNREGPGKWLIGRLDKPRCFQRAAYLSICRLRDDREQGRFEENCRGPGGNLRFVTLDIHLNQDGILAIQDLVERAYKYLACDDVFVCCNTVGVSFPTVKRTVPFAAPTAASTTVTLSPMLLTSMFRFSVAIVSGSGSTAIERAPHTAEASTV